MSGNWLLSWCFFLPVIAAFGAIPFSSALSRTVARALAVVNLLVPIGFYFGAETVWMDTIRGLSLGGGPVPLQLDALTLPFLLLIKGAALLSLGENPNRLGRTYLSCVFGADFALSASVLVGDGFASIFFAELSLIPLCLLIGTWGGHDRLYASRKFFLSQTAACGLWLMAVAIQAAAHETQFGFFSGLPADLGKVVAPGERIAFLCFLGACFLRSAIFPLHSWLPESLAQGPLAGGLFIVGGVLPSGTLALIKMGIPVFPEGFDGIRASAGSLMVAGAIYSAVLAWRQNDGYRYLAYGGSFLSALVFAGLLQASPTPWTASAFHLLAGTLSLLGLLVLFHFCSLKRQSRQFPDWAGLGNQFPDLRAFVLFFLTSLLFIPGTGSFPGAFSLLSESLDRNPIWCVGLLAALFFSAVSAMRVGGTIAFGETAPSSDGPHSGVGPGIRVSLVALVILLIAMGLAPRIALQSLHSPIDGFWDSFSAREKFLVPSSAEPHQSLKREFRREEQP